MSVDPNIAEILIALITAIGSYFSGFRHGRGKFRRMDAMAKAVPLAQWERIDALDERLSELEKRRS